MSANAVELGSARRGPPDPVQEGRSMHTAIDGAPADPFGTARIRRRVLAAWSADPARFREDANAEEGLVRGGYRDRLLVELAQNAADAAVRAGVPGRLRLRLPGGGRRAGHTRPPRGGGRGRGRPPPAPRWAGTASRGWPPSAPRPSGTSRPPSAGSGSASPRCSRS